MSKSDFLNALEGRPHKNIPLWELEFHLWDQFSRERFFCGMDFFHLSKKEQEKALFRNADIMAEVTDKLGFSAVTIPGSYWELAPGHPSFYWLPGDYRVEQARLLKKLLSENTSLVVNTGGVLAIPDAAQYIDFSCTMLEDPGSIDYLAEKTLENGLENLKRYVDLGIDVMMTASDIADNSGPYFSPDQMDRFILPYLEKWAHEVKKAGAKSVLHTDGNITPCLEFIIETGVNAIQAIDPVAGMDMVKTLEKVQGKICLCGNIDCGVLATANPEQVYESTTKLLTRAGNYRGFILGASNAVQQEVPAENYRALSDSLKSFRKL